MKRVIFDNSLMGLKLKNKRLALNLTLTELSHATSISSHTLSRYEKGITLPSLKNLVALANALDLSLDEMLIYAIV